mmetsp:Transcript_8883/g.24108  ORF Transcript_8883/g.24108 Transcript_8883/m.24108 type:complete len:144 (+) Transcript_8883:783-1214(+)
MKRGARRWGMNMMEVGSGVGNMMHALRHNWLEDEASFGGIYTRRTWMTTGQDTAQLCLVFFSSYSDNNSEMWGGNCEKKKGNIQTALKYGIKKILTLLSSAPTLTHTYTHTQTRRHTHTQTHTNTRKTHIELKDEIRSWTVPI